jgi:hypothetical protein
MIAQELLHQQRELTPKQDLAQFAGEWVVLRGGRVVAHAQEMAELISRGDVRDRDAVIRISDLPVSFVY